MNHYAEHITYKYGIYQKAMASTEYGQVIIASGMQDYHFRDDIPVPFTANAYFREWLPLLQYPDCFLLVNRDADKPKLILRVVSDYWHSAPKPLPAAIADAFDVVEYATAEDLTKLLPSAESSAFIGPETMRLQGLTDVAVNPEDLLAYIDYHRAWKTEYEMDNMREANRMAVRGHRAAEKAFREGLSEYEIHMAYLLAVGCREEELPYGNIVALNNNAAVLHHMMLGRQRPQHSRSFLIDAGAQYKGYASDITRTYVGEESDDDSSQECFSALIAGVEKLQLNLVENLKPGIDYCELHTKAHRSIAALLAALDIITVSPEEAVSEGVTSAFFPHGVGHLIGTQVHDKGGYLISPTGELREPEVEHRFLRCTRTVEERMAFTVEPGIYLIPMLLEPWREKGGVLNWPLIEQLLPYGGIRIEDDVIVHVDRVENLTRNAFSQHFSEHGC